MRQQSVDREIRVIVRFTLFMFTLGAVILLALAYWMPFDVKLHALYDDAQGNFYVRDLRGSEHEFESGRSIKLQPGEELRLDGDSSGRIEVIADMNAYAYVTAPVIWGLEQAQRRATAFQHVLARENGTYDVVIKQESGVVVYDFSESDTPLRDLNLVVRLLDGEFTPSSDCFQASSPSESAPGAVVEIPCYEEAQPQIAPTEIPLP